MTSVAEDPSPPPPPRARRRRALWIAASLVAVVLVLVAMLPMLLSTGAGASMIAGMIDDSIAGSVTIDSLSLRWFGGQQVGGLTLLDPEGQPVLTAERAATELSLWRAIRGNLSLGETVIAGVAAQIVRGADGLTNLQRAVESTRPPSDEPARLPPSLHGTVKVEGRANVSGAGIEQPVSMDIQGTFTLAGGGGPISVDLATTARQGDIRGRLTAKGEIHNLAAEDGTLTLLRAVPKLALAGDELPADGLDAMLGLKGRLAAALGETVTAQVHTGGTAEALELGLTLRSPNATADVAALLAGGQSISLTRPAKVTLIATPELLDAMLAPGEDRAALQLVRPVPLDLTAEQVQLTFDDLAASSFIARAVAREPVLFVGDERIGQITAQNLAVNLDSRRLGQAVTFAANVDTIADGQPGKLAVRGELLEVLSSEARRVDVSAQLTNLPSVLVDRLAGLDALLHDALGPQLDVSATAISDADRSVRLIANAQAAHLQADVAGQLPPSLDRITLSNSRANLTLTPALLRRWSGDDGPLAPASVAVAIDRFQMPLGAQANIDDVEIAATVDVTPSDPQDRVAAALGSALSMTLRTQAARRGARPLALTVRSENISADVVGDILADGEKLNLVLREPARTRLKATNALLALAGREPLLAGPTPVELVVEKLTATAKPFSMATVQTQATANLARIEWAGEGDLRGAVLSDAAATFAFDGSRGTATLRMNGRATAPGQEQPGPVQIDVAASNLLSADGALQMSVAIIDLKEIEMTALPTAFVDASMNQQGRLLAVAGPVMNMKASGRLTGLGPARGTLEARFESPTFVLDAPLKLTEMTELTRPLTMRIELTQEVYAALMAPRAPNGAAYATPANDSASRRLALNRPGRIDVTLQDLGWPRGDEPFDPSRARIDARVKATRLEFVDPATRQVVAIDALAASAKAPSLAQPLIVTVSGEIPGSRGSPAGAIAVNAELADLYGENGLATETMSVKLDARLDRFPVAIADGLMQYDGLLLAALGSTMDVSASGALKQMNGPVSLKLATPQANMAIPAVLEDQWLTLSEPVTGELRITKELSDKLFARLSPFLRGVRKDEPVLLTMQHEGFRVPWRGFEMQKVTVPLAVLELGQMTVENDVVMQGLMRLLRAEAGREMPGWFTPAVVKVENGKLTFVRRLDILLGDNFHVATWGEADLTAGDGTETRYRQTLALSPEALSRVYRLDGLKADQFLRIPVRGSSGRPEIDYGRAISDVGRLVAQREAAQANPLLGAALRQLTGELLGGAPVPPPSLDPLPWKAQRPAAAEQPDQPQPQPARERDKSTEERLLEGALELLKRREKK